MRRRPGFTLIELLIVVVVIGVLASIAVAQFDSSRQRAHYAVLRADLAHLVLHQELHYHTYGRFGDLSELSGVVITEGVSAEVTWVGTDGFATTLGHVALPGVECGYFTGNAPEGAAGPAVAAGSLACE